MIATKQMALFQQPAKYFVLSLKDVPRSSVDLVISLGFDMGATGSEEPLSFHQSNLAYEADSVETPFANLRLYFAHPPPSEFITSLKAHCNQLDFLEEENKDWMAEWKKHFQPVLLVDPHWVVPSWLVPPVNCKSPIYIDPGMAFGTGTHETTQLACQLVQIAVRQKANASFVDIGTGTGILSIIAEREGAGRILANDIDPEATRVARENFEKNGLDIRCVTDLPIEKINDRFDIVVANILDHVLVLLGESLTAILKPGGLIVVSGVLNQNESDFIRDFFHRHGLKILERRERNEWIGFLGLKDA